MSVIGPSQPRLAQKNSTSGVGRAFEGIEIDGEHGPIKCFSTNRAKIIFKAMSLCDHSTLGDGAYNFYWELVYESYR